MSVSLSRRDPDATRRRWVERLERFRRSGQTIAQFCVAEGISQPSFYIWKRTLAASVDTPVSPAPAPNLVPIRITPPSETPIELALRSGIVVRFPGGTSPQMIVAVLQGVEERPC